jgi:hypothetical protein
VFRGEEMIGRFIKSQIRKNKDLILDEVREVDGFFQLLMKHRNTGIKWSPSEKVQLKQYLRRLIGHAPVLCIFLLPAGFLLIPLLAEVIDRRKRSRRPGEDGR